MPRSPVELRNLTTAIAPAVVVMLIGLTVLGCQEPKTATLGDAEEQNGQAQAQVQDQEVAFKGRGQLWSENCMRCHNIRDPKSLSDSQWKVALHQMRVRGNLLAEEHKAVLELMQASN
jgi:nitrate/TMAO reductase-like tetraheme cytochrome c subunit